MPPENSDWLTLPEIPSELRRRGADRVPSYRETYNAVVDGIIPAAAIMGDIASVGPTFHRCCCSGRSTSPATTHLGPQAPLRPVRRLTRNPETQPPQRAASTLGRSVRKPKAADTAWLKTT